MLVKTSLKGMILLIIQYLEDAGGRLTIETVQDNKHKDSWKGSENEALGLGFTKSAFWVRFDIENASLKETEFYLEQRYPLIDDLRLYIPGKDGYRSIETGDKKPFRERPFKYRTFIFPLKIEPGTSLTYYLRYSSNSSMNIELRIWSPREFIDHIYIEAVYLWMFFGIMFIMAAYNMFVYLSIRDKVYLYLIIYIIAFSIFELSMQGFSFQFLWPNSIWWANNNIPFFMGLVIFSFTQFGRYYIGLDDRTNPVTRYGDIPLKILMATGIIISISSLLINNYRVSIIAATAATAVTSPIKNGILLLAHHIEFGHRN